MHWFATPRLRVAAVSAVAAVVIVALAAMWWQLDLDSDRMLGVVILQEDGSIRVDTVGSDGPAVAAGVREGDVIAAIGGEPVTDFASFNRAWERLERGSPVVVTLRRDGRSFDATVLPGTRFPWLRFGSSAVASLLHLALAALVLISAPHDLRARLLFGLSSAIAVELALPATFEAVPWWPTLAPTTFYLLTGLQLGLELHLATEIPTRQGWSDRPWLRPAFYGAAAAVAAIGAVSALTYRLTEGRLAELAFGVELFLDSAALNGWALAVVVILLLQLRGAASGRHRHQVRLVLAGVVPWAVYMLTVEALYQLGVPTPPWLTLIQPLVLMLYPVAFFVAMFHYHLFDLQFVLRRSLVFTIVTVGLAALFVVAFQVGRVLFTRSDTTDQASVAALSLSMLALGLLFAPLRRLAQSFVDRRLFPEQLEMRSTLADIAARLPSEGTLTAMGRLLVERLSSALNLSSATLLVADPASGVLVTLASSTVDLESQFGQSLLLDPDDPGVLLLRRTGHPIPSDQMMAVSPSMGQRMAAFDTEIAIGLQSGDVTVGVLMLGAKASGDRFRSDEMELLTLFSHAVATVFENARLIQSATVESLTGLLRREAILAALEREMQRAVRYRRPLTVGMADIDFFKEVNDRYGHLAGDALLKRVARSLADGLRASDAIGRFGGEEFLFFLPETELEGALQVAEKLREAIADIRDAVESAPDARVTISIGLAELDHDQPATCDPRALIDAADQSLLQAKRRGRNRVVASTVAA